MSKRIKVTAEMLRELIPCSDGWAERFEEIWPDGTYVTKKACLTVADWSPTILHWAWEKLILPRIDPVAECPLCLLEDATTGAVHQWQEAGRPPGGPKRVAAAQAQANVFWRSAKGILR